MTSKKAYETKRRIIESTRQLIASKGIENISINQIIQHAKSSKGSFYYHFGGLDEVLKETFLSVLNESLEPFSLDSTKSLKANVKAYFYELIQTVNEKKEEYGLLFLFISKSFQEPRYTRLFQDMRQQIIEENILSTELLATYPNTRDLLPILDMMTLGVLVHTNLEKDQTLLMNLIDHWLDGDLFEEVTGE